VKARQEAGGRRRITIVLKQDLVLFQDKRQILFLASLKMLQWLNNEQLYWQ
jgi:hypothetical protein